MCSKQYLEITSHTGVYLCSRSITLVRNVLTTTKSTLSGKTHPTIYPVLIIQEILKQRRVNFCLTPAAMQQLRP